MSSRARFSIIVFRVNGGQGCAIRGFIPTSVIQGNLLHITRGVGLWESLSAVSQKWIPFPRALAGDSVTTVFAEKAPPDELGT